MRAQRTTTKSKNPSERSDDWKEEGIRSMAVSEFLDDSLPQVKMVGLRSDDRLNMSGAEEILLQSHVPLL